MLYTTKHKQPDRHIRGHVFGEFQKKQSQGNGNRKRGSYKHRKAYRGQGK